MKRSGTRSPIARYDDSNHCRIGAGETSTGAPATRGPGTACSSQTSATRSTPRNALAHHVRRAIELRDGAVDPVVVGEIPVAEYPAIGRPQELHVRLEQSAH